MDGLRFRVRPPPCQPLFADANLIIARFRRSIAVRGVGVAKVFLSYDRSDGAIAQALAGALEKAGHSVWWDRHITGGAQYSKEIERALADCDAVVVLWSSASIESEWVRDEAAEGRDRGALVPVLIERIKPPIGFRQFQTIDLTGWKGQEDSRGLAALFAAVATLSRNGAEPTASPSGTDTGRTARFWPAKAIAAGAALLLLLLIAGVTAYRLSSWGRPASATVVTAIVPADASAQSRDYARGLLAKLGSLRPSSLSSVELVGDAARKRASLLFEVGSTASGEVVHASVVLTDGAKGTLLWSSDFEQPAAHVGDLRQQLAVSTAKALECALEAYSPSARRLTREQAKAYVGACAAMADSSYEELPALVPVFRKLVRSAPRFEAGWGKLLLAQSGSHNVYLSPAEDRRLRSDVARDIASARKLNPAMAEAYEAELELLPLGRFREESELVERAIRDHPDRAQFLLSRSNLNLRTGRLGDAVEDARRAVDLDPISPHTRNRFIYTLAQAGRTDAALKAVEEADRLWPDASVLDDVRWGFYLRYGDPEAALAMIRDGTAPARFATAESFLKARLDPNAANVERAVAEARQWFERDPTSGPHFLQVLGTFGRTDEQVKTLEAMPLARQIDFGEVLFRPSSAAFWRDPRSLDYARRIGLLGFWRDSGKWPDFCSAPDLAYDCRAEAAKRLR